MKARMSHHKGYFVRLFWQLWLSWQCFLYLPVYWHRFCSILGWSSTVLLIRDFATVLFRTSQGGGKRETIGDIETYGMLWLAVSELARFYCTSQLTMKSSLRPKNRQVQEKNNASVNSCGFFLVLFSSWNTIFLETILGDTRLLTKFLYLPICLCIL